MLQCLICKKPIEEFDSELESEESTNTYEVVHLKCYVNLRAYREEINAFRQLPSAS